MLSLPIATAAQAQGSRTELPRELDGSWELVAVNGQPLPLPPVREGADPTECGAYGEFVGQRVGEGRLVIRTEEMWMGPRSERWEGGVYAYIPEEVVCRGGGGRTIVLRRDAHNRVAPASEVEPVWQGPGSYGVADSTASLAVGDFDWTWPLPTAGAGAPPDEGSLTLRDEDGVTWSFRRAQPGPRFDTPGFVSVRGDFDADGQPDQVSVTPGRHGSRWMVARLAAGPVAQVAEVPAEAHVALARRGMTWRNSDGSSLRLTDREAILVSAEPATERSDVTIYFVRNGVWTAWEYAPD